MIKKYKSCIFAGAKQYFGVLLAVLLLVAAQSAGAQTWVPVGTPGFSTDSVLFCTIAIDSAGTPYVAYRNQPAGAVSVKKLNDTGWATVGRQYFSDGGTENTSIAIGSGGQPWVAYTDLAHGGKATVKKFSDTGWVTVGVEGFSANSAYYTSLAIDHSGTPYVAFEDGYLSLGPATVMKFDGSNWVVVGLPGFSANAIEGTSIALDAGGLPYVAYTDRGDSFKATVMKFNGTNWVNVGVEGFSAGRAEWPSLALDPTGIPYVVYGDDAYGQSATVMKFNGANWVYVGAPGFSTTIARMSAIAVDKTGAPYIAFQANDCISCATGPATVMKYTGGDWISVGNPVISVGTAWFTNIAIDPSGVPYIVYEDYAYGERVTVMKPGPACPITGDTIVCLGDAATILHDTCHGGSWSSSDTAIAVVGVTGAVRGVTVGTAIITYTVAGSVDTFKVYVSPCLINNGVNNTANPKIQSISITPNPNNGLFSLYLSAPESEPALITVTNMLGQKVKDFTIITNRVTEVRLDVPAGIYFLSAITKTGIVTEKIVME